jgi:hypothetical protein
LAGAGGAAAWLMTSEHGSAHAFAIAAAYGVLVLHNELFARRIAAGRLDVRSTYRWAMRTSMVSTAGFLCFIGLQLAGAV